MQDLELKGIPDNSYISSPTRTLEVLRKHDIRLKKTLGQNFLIDTNILKKIVRGAGVSDGDVILEIGSGIGSLTEILLHKARKVICIEIDKKLGNAFNEIFDSHLGKRVVLVEKDAMKIDYPELIGDNKVSKVVSNLPYKIAAPVIIKLLLEAMKIDEMYFTIQKDIASRLTAGVGEKDYSSYTVKANYLADFKVLFKIERTCFFPVPFVDSVFIKSKRKTGMKKMLSSKETPYFFNFIDACFAHRRKKLINSIQASGYSALVDKIDIIAKMLHGIGKDTSIRAENLKLEEFLNLFNSIRNGIK
jgi:16S rRNA (adenine1518-N6/adenine1519-N6)-dimethyltransferase